MQQQRTKTSESRGCDDATSALTRFGTLLLHRMVVLVSLLFDEFQAQGVQDDADAGESHECRSPHGGNLPVEVEEVG